MYYKFQHVDFLGLRVAHDGNRKSPDSGALNLLHVLGCWNQMRILYWHALLLNIHTGNKNYILYYQYIYNIFDSNLVLRMQLMIF